MWPGQAKDPGGSGPGPDNTSGATPDDPPAKQQAFVTQLQEVWRRNDQTVVTQEKLEEYANELARMNARAKKGKRREGEEGRRVSETPANEKVSLLRLQLEETKAKLAERGKSQKGIEEMVIQLKAQFDDSQSIINQSPLNLSLAELKPETYSVDSSSQELYKILVTKEKRITDLVNRVHKLEATVLDLQENVKEKDQVIDARTKAITLMSESLSKKGKTTLDALEETKEQMRQMQGTFVQLEAQMKVEKQVLQSELHKKNVEVQALEEKVEKFQSGSSEDYKAKIEDLQSNLETSDEEILKLQDQNASYAAKIAELETLVGELKARTDEVGEVAKLRKQLDESNKNMIKVKAQSKSKIKELNKKLEAFKQISDTNAEIVRLETENTKLKTKIEELEGAQKHADVENVAAMQQRINDLEKQLDQLSENLATKTEEINSLKETSEQLLAERAILTDQLDQLSHVQNTQVTSQFDSIAFEEQLEKLETESEALLAANKELIETIEALNKEKTDLASKLETYMQENADLADKLEKLSAEKVSSAESIEIVEALTQQEKLELEAYQNSIKTTSEENLAGNPELNESVSQLTEETADLMRKIELFTLERREVMDKMEALSHENAQLNSRLKEVENNRDVLAETYEHLQNEKDILDNKLSRVEEEQAELSEKMALLQEENSQLKRTLTKDEPVVDNRLVEEIDDLKRTIEELREEKRNEIADYKRQLRSYEVSLDENTTEILASAKIINELRNDLEAKRQEITHLNGVVRDLENQNRGVDIMERQLKDLKDAFNENLEQIRKYEEHSEANSAVIADLKLELDAMNERMCETQRLLDVKNEEIRRLTDELKAKEIVVSELQDELKAKKETFHKVCDELREKCLSMQAQITHNSDAFEDLKKPLEHKIDELTAKNREQLEKMKKLAANLKKKTQAYKELELLLDEKTQQLDLKDAKILDNETKIKSLVEQLADVENAFETRKTDEDSRQQLEYESKTTTDALHAKIQELESFIETQDAELSANKDRVSKLEEVLGNLEERRASLERKNMELEEKSQSFEEISRAEDVLEMRLRALVEHDEAVERQLKEIGEENAQLQVQNRNLLEEKDDLSVKFEGAQRKLAELTHVQQNFADLQAENADLRKSTVDLEANLRQVRNDYEQKLQDKKRELETVDLDLQEHFVQTGEERKSLLEKIERLTDQLNEAAVNEESLKTKIAGLEQQLNEFEVEYQRMREENQALQSEVQDLRVTSEHLKALQNEVEELKSAKTEQIVSQSDIQPSVQPKEEPFLEELLQVKSEEIPKFDLFSSQSPSAHAEIFDFIAPNEGTKTNSNDETSNNQKRISELEELVRNLQQKLENENQTKAPANFSWPESAADPFKFVQNPDDDSQRKNQDELLLQKIKTLEFMLYNVERDKEEALTHCHELTKELTLLVYERERPLEAQIVENVEDSPEMRRQMHDLEFEPTRSDYGPRSEPVVEDELVPKTAYVCQPEEPDAQIVRDVPLTPDERKQLHDLEFTPIEQPTVKVDASGRPLPADERPAVVKTAYKCFDDPITPNEVAVESNSASNYFTFGENDDGWGWGPEETRLEEAHVQTTAANAREIRALRLEREAHVEEIKQLQLKASKLVKKLKEFKLKNDRLQSQLTSSDLDGAIQDELKHRVEAVEKKSTELVAELDKERLEKDSLKKRIDVLTSANERLVEMKEKQDMEVMVWQQRNRELTAKLEQFDWGDDGFDFDSSKRTQDTQKTGETGADAELRKKIQELNDVIKELSLDNEELQALLEEQRHLRLNAERAKSIEPIPENMKSEGEFLAVVHERDALQGQLDVSGHEKKQMQEQINELIKRNGQLEEKLLDVSTSEALVAEKEKLIEDLSEKLRAFEYTQQNSSSVHTEEIQRLTNEITALVTEKEKLFVELQDKNAQIFDLNESVNAQLTDFKSQLEKQTQLCASLHETLELKDREVQQKATELRQKDDELTEKNGELQLITTQLQEKQKELLEFDQKLTTTIETVSQEWANKVDQRGTDIAESWKLHLDLRETEFAQLEQRLRKELQEADEKCNSLVNENNELRKNVDAEIRNEVDRVGAMQRQIDELTGAVKERQDGLEIMHVQLLDYERKSVQLTEELNECELKASKLSEENDELKRQLRQLEDELSTKTGVITDLREQLDTLEESVEESQRIRAKLEEKDAYVADLNVRFQEIQSKRESETLAQVFEYQQQISGLNAQLESYQEQFRLLNGDLQNCSQLLQTKEAMIVQLHEQTSGFEETKTQLLEQVKESEVLRRRLNETETSYEEILSTKDADVESLRLQLQTVTKKHNSLVKQLEDLQNSLERKQTERDQLEAHVTQQNLLLDEERKQMSDQRTIIEEQVLKIEDLKNELFRKSNDYDALIAEFDMQRAHLADQTKIIADSPASETSVSHDTEEDDLLEPVSRAELDLALYMLHQRDMRCEELTVELMQLLGERDTLQLRLSNALREKEELRRRVVDESSEGEPDKTDVSSDGGSGASKTRTSDSFHGASGAELAAEAVQGEHVEADRLANKLSELKTVGYRKDKTIVDEQQLRRLQELTLMQQRRDAASRMPPEAAARLVDASYTLSRDVQSPSKVLMNWLWGKSTPKVNDV